MVEPTPLRGVFAVPITSIRANPWNVRHDVGDVSELASSIREQGILQPVSVEDWGDHYLLIAGHRRVAAARAAGLTKVPAIVRHATSRPQQLTQMLVENLQRSELTPLETAQAVGALVEQGMTGSEIARKVGKSVAWVSHKRALLELPEEELLALQSGQISQAVAVEEVQARRRAARDGRKRERGWAPPYFARSHQLAAKAELLCDGRQHNKRGRVGGVACGACWERVIREDEQVAITAEQHLEDEVAS